MPRLLAQETLSPDQVWWAVACPQGEDQPEDVLLIADDRKQALGSLVRAGRDPWLTINETELKALMKAAFPQAWKRVSQRVLRLSGLPDWWVPIHRYGLAVHQENEGLQWFWLSAPNPAAALHQLNEQALDGELVHLIDVQALLAIEQQLEALRTSGGEGAYRDARFEGEQDARQRALAIDASGGEAAYRARLEALRASLGQSRPDPEDPFEVAV